MAAFRTVMPVLSRMLYRVTGPHTRGVSASGLRVSAETSSDMRKDSWDLLKQFPKPKELLQTAISRGLQSSNVKDQITYINAESSQDCRVILRVRWPKLIQVEGYGESKVQAEYHAAAKACQIFQKLGLLKKGSLHKKVTAEEKESESSADDLAAIEALKEFPSPKMLLANVIRAALSTSDIKSYIQYHCQGNKIKECRLTLSWPQSFTFVARGSRKMEVEKKVAALACQKLKDLGLLGQDNKPLTHAKYHSTAITMLRKQQSQPWKFTVPEDVLARMENHFKEFPPESQDESDLETFSISRMKPENLLSNDGMVIDPITGQVYTPLSEDKAAEINRSLYANWCHDPVEPLKKLPVSDYSSAILAAIDSNPVVVIAGDTGCGKTTRIPRLILEEAILRGQGAHCNVMITQPRRISAVSVAHRVAQELGPNLSRNVGYHVRLQSELPPRGGALLFCTVGVMLKKLQSNPSLEGISHLIVDEVHERDVSTDFLLILAKQVQKLNPNIKVILMSATGNNQLLSKYFGDCPVVRVPGFMYPVKQHYLDDLLPMMGISSYPLPETIEECVPNLDLISQVILHVYHHGEPGSILCFLPGWQEIREVMEILEERLGSQNGKYLILPVHSNIPLSNQQYIFQRPPEGVRKIVLATNIAETSVTIDDIVHVVDSGMLKEQRYDLQTKVSCLETSWVSKSNIIQRRGRAGRCQPGFSYHVFSYQQFEKLVDFQEPEILRTPLENLVLQAKIHNPEKSAVEFLSQAIECPDLEAIGNAVEMLQEIRVLDENEELTSLGKRVVHISTDPSLAKAIVLSAIFRCVKPLLAIVASLTRSPFLGGLLNRAAVSKSKAEWSEETYSDHLAFVRIFQAWNNINRKGAPYKEDFLQDNVLSKHALHFIQSLVLQLSSNAHDAKIVSQWKDCMNDHAICNQFSNEDELVTGVLLAGLYPRLIRVRRGQVVRGKFRPNNMEFRKDGRQVFLHRTTVNRERPHFPSPWLTYYEAMKSNGAVFIRDSSMVNPLAALLLADCFITCEEHKETKVLSLPSYSLLKLESDKRTVDLLGELRYSLQLMVNRCLRDQFSNLSRDEEYKNTQLLSILVDVLNSTADRFIEPSEPEQ